jgi:hypothetical protein
LNNLLVLQGTPDSGIPPTDYKANTAGFDASDFVFNVLSSVRSSVTFLSLQDNAGIDLPGQNSDTITLEDAFALEGLEPDDQLQLLTSIGDFNGDGSEDFIAGGANGKSFILFGPVFSSTLSRVESNPTNPNGPEIKIRGEAWDVSRTYDVLSEYLAVSPYMRAEGRAEQLAAAALDDSLVPAIC